MHIPESKLKEIVIKNGLVTEPAYSKAKDESIRLNTTIENVLIGQSGMNERFFFDALAQYLKTQILHVSPEMQGNAADYNLIPETTAKSRGIFVVAATENLVTLAMTDPNDLSTINYVEQKLGRHVEPMVVSIEDFAELTKLYKRSIGKEFQRIIDENAKKLAASKGRDRTLATELPVITMFDTILEHAASSKASDIHIESSQETLVIRYRIDGILHDIVELPAAIQLALIARIKIMSNLQIDEHRVPQDGRFRFTFEDEQIAVRVSIMPTLHGEKAVLRLLAGSRRPLNIDSLGATKRNHDLLLDCIKRSNGLILVTGPTGSGKTTTLYTLITILNKPEVSIATIEDPIEYDMKRVNQTQVNEKTGLTFAEGLRSFLRQNPDIMMVGEIRDSETAELAIHASLTGHLVLTTLHTDDAATAIPRMIDLNAEPFLLASTLRTVVAQRLVRRLCPDCTESKPVDENLKALIIDQMARSNKYKANLEVPLQLYHGRGCPKCGGTGYRGQIGIFEVLDASPEITDLILKRESSEMVKDVALRQGMITMFEDGLEKAESGITSIDEVFRVIRA